MLVADGRVYTHSAAVLHIAARLGGFWRLAAVGWLLPGPWRDALYRLLARHTLSLVWAAGKLLAAHS